MEGANLLPAEVTTLLTAQAGNIVPTTLAVIAIVIPVGIACWAIGLAVKKGLNFLQRKASKAF